MMESCRFQEGRTFESEDIDIWSLLFSPAEAR